MHLTFILLGHIPRLDLRKGDGCLGASGLANGARVLVPKGPFLDPAIAGREEGAAFVGGGTR